MNTSKYVTYTILILIISLQVIQTSVFCYDYITTQGYYPVSSKGAFCNRPTPTELPQNPLYKEWWQEHFANGSSIYEAYRVIAFDIEYTPELPNVDLWQTPLETMQNHKGDCEDAILLFHDLLPSDYDKGEIIWGVVFDRQKSTHFAHVWFQLYDKGGAMYIVEPFSGDWNGIIPIETIKEGETRQSIVSLTNTTISDIIMGMSYSYEYAKYLLSDRTLMRNQMWIRQVDDVFKKLTEVSLRYREQRQR